MLVKHIRVGNIFRTPAYQFGSQTHSHQPDHTRPSKHNPQGIKDLRGHNNIDKLTPAEQAFSPIHNTQYNIFSAYHLCSLLSNRIARTVGSIVENPETALSSDSLHLPRIYSNGVPVYDSINSLNTFIITNKLLTRFAPLFLAVAAPTPALTLGIYLLGFYGYRQFLWNLSQHLVFKLELLPNTQEVVYQKISIFGSIVTRKAKITDLEYTTIENICTDNDGGERATRGLINKEVVFKIKGTSELLLFEKGGIWNAEGLNHSLLI